MENASKALLMAAAILISVIILTLGVYLFMYFADYASGVEDDVRANQIAQFNSQFLSYQGKDLTVYDVITLANMAKDYNQENGYYDSNTKGYITVNANIIDTNIGSKPNSSNNISEIDQGKIGVYDDDYKLITYHCSIEMDEITKLVSKITITK